jgi:hypothetical protein
LYTFFGGDEYGGGTQFFKFKKYFKKLIIPSINVASFRRGSRDKFFLMGPEVKKTGRQKLLQQKYALTLSQVIFCT